MESKKPEKVISADSISRKMTTMDPSSPQAFNILVIGPPKTGKTSLIETFKSAFGSSGCTESNDASDNPIGVYLMTSSGCMFFKFYICQAKPDEPEFHGIIFVYDITRSSTYRRIPTLYMDCLGLVVDRPIVVVGNKLDKERRRSIKEESVALKKIKGVKFYEVSAENGLNIEKPFLHLARILTGDPTLTITQPT